MSVQCECDHVKLPQSVCKHKKTDSLRVEYSKKSLKSSTNSSRSYTSKLSSKSSKEKSLDINVEEKSTCSKVAGNNSAKSEDSHMRFPVKSCKSQMSLASSSSKK